MVWADPYAGEDSVLAGSYAVGNGASAVVAVDLVIPGCPPSPAALLNGLLALMGRGTSLPDSHKLKSRYR